MARYPVYRPRHKRGTRRLVWLVVLAVLAFGVWYHFFNKPEDTNPNPHNPGNNSPNGTVITKDPNGGIGETGPGERIPVGTAEQRAQAKRDFDQGMHLKNTGKIIVARRMLSQGLRSGLLDKATQDIARKELTAIANVTILSKRIYDGDPYADQYVIKDGEGLQKIERKLKLYVPWQGLLMINKLRSDRRIRAGQALKMIKGPFHAIVYKKEHVMDLYLHRDRLEKIFVRRMPVGLGKDGSTPLGNWKVINKLLQGDYFPSVNSPYKRRRIRYGEPNYAFGKKGIWIGLKGMDADNINIRGIGIHSTNEPDSVGKDVSEGCIRMADGDIDLVFALFYEHQRAGQRYLHKSTVQIMP